jgi:hypothetical protein
MSSGPPLRQQRLNSATNGEAREFELTSAETARTGVQVCRYRRAS